MIEAQKLRVAAIGTGSLGRHHVRNFADITKGGSIELVGVCDKDSTTVETIAAQYSVAKFVDWRDLLSMVDAVSIATPTETHCEIACAFLEKGVHVLVEKPIAMTLAEADRMIEAADSTGAKLMVGQLERFNPAMVALRPHIFHRSISRYIGSRLSPTARLTSMWF